MKHTEHFLPVVLFLSLLAVYGMTLAPSLTWANRGADGGDLLTAAATGGIPHPTGYPVYLLLARLFQFLPIGSLAFRTNLLSALAAAGASVLVYKLVTRSLPSKNQLAGLISGCAFGLSPLLWSQAVITEVYTLHALFIALILYCSLFPPFKEKKKSDLALGLAIGIALGNHLTTLLLLPVLLVPSVLIQDKRWQMDFRCLFHRLSGMGLGLLVYLILPLRALAHPPINWGNPVTWKGFSWLVFGRLYQDEVFALTLPSLWERIRSASTLLVTQFGILGLCVSLLGCIFFLRRSPLFCKTLWILTAFSVFAIVYATEDSFVYFISPVMCFAVWIGLGVDGLMEVASRRIPHLSWAVALLILISLIFVARGNWSQVDASQDARAEQFGMLVMSQIPEDTIVFAQGDPAIFSLWYYHYALHQRTDIAVIAIELLQFDWYQETLKATYPSLSVPEPYPYPDTLIAANPNRPVCIVEYEGQANIRCP
jgi:Protein of unknown function (DUF2723)